MKNQFLLKYLDNQEYTQNLKNRQSEIDTFAKKIMIEEMSLARKTEEVYPLKYLDFIKIRKLRSLIFTEKYSDNVARFKEILKLSKNLVNKNNSELYFVFLPSHPSYGLSKHLNDVKNVVDELQIPFIDISKEAFNIEDQTIFFPFGFHGHYNKYGLRKVSETIYSLTNN